MQMDSFGVQNAAAATSANNAIVKDIYDCIQPHQAAVQKHYASALMATFGPTGASPDVKQKAEVVWAVAESIDILTENPTPEDDGQLEIPLLSILTFFNDITKQYDSYVEAEINSISTMETPPSPTQCTPEDVVVVGMIGSSGTTVLTRSESKVRPRQHLHKILDSVLLHYGIVPFETLTCVRICRATESLLMNRRPGPEGNGRADGGGSIARETPTICRASSST
jgi:hypothetical protein